MSRAVAWMVDAVEEGILTESEVQAVVRFLAGKFVERRMSTIMQKFFDVGAEERCTFRALKSSLK